MSDSVYYGDAENPAYNIISYTWGRWQDPVHGEAIYVTGPDRDPLGWQVPKVNPGQAFSPEDFRSVLSQVAGGLRFVWVDVACINQNTNVPESAAEIGRQAAIFKRGREGYVWLHQTPASQIHDSLKLMLCIRDHVDVDQCSMCGHHKDHMETVNCLLQDPWFSSLWTLQEAFIKKDAIFLSKEGHVIRLLGHPLTVSALAALCTKVSRYMFRPTQTLITNAGLNQLQALNPLVLLSTSSKRTTLKREDRIYGIMQVFGLRLGKSAADHGHEVYNLQQLEQQLSQQLIAKFPTLSQMFLHRDQRPEGQEMYYAVGTQTPDRHFRRYGAIRPGLDLTMAVPDEFWHTEQVEPACSFTFEQRPGIQFHGTLLPLEQLYNKWLRNEGEPGSVEGVVYTDQGKTPEMNRFDRSLWLDHCSGVEAEGVVPVGDLKMTSFTRPVAVARSMVNRYPDRFTVLVLGRIKDGNSLVGQEEDEVYVGVLARRNDETRSYKRVGFCTWVGWIEGKQVEVVL